MLDKNINAIIFDFGGVLINIDYTATVESFRLLGIDDFDELYSQAKQSNLFDDIETGKISPQRFINALLDYLPAGTSPNAVVHAWNAMILDVPNSTIDLLNRLKRENYRLFLLSNTNEIHIKAALQAWDKASEQRPEMLFNKVYLSHEMHMRKPNKEIFDFVIKEQSLDPNKTVFIDDSIQHIEGAKLSGLTTIHLTRHEMLQEIFS
jgi:glucose-1-phosphatase